MATEVNYHTFSPGENRPELGQGLRLEKETYEHVNWSIKVSLKTANSKEGKPLTSARSISNKVGWFL